MARLKLLFLVSTMRVVFGGNLAFCQDSPLSRAAKIHLYLMRVAQRFLSFSFVHWEVGFT